MNNAKKNKTRNGPGAGAKRLAHNVPTIALWSCWFYFVIAAAAISWRRWSHETLQDGFLTLLFLLGSAGLVSLSSVRLGARLATYVSAQKDASERRLMKASCYIFVPFILFFSIISVTLGASLTSCSVWLAIPPAVTIGILPGMERAIAKLVCMSLSAIVYSVVCIVGFGVNRPPMSAVWMWLDLFRGEIGALYLLALACGLAVEVVRLRGIEGSVFRSIGESLLKLGREARDGADAQVPRTSTVKTMAEA